MTVKDATDIVLTAIRQPHLLVDGHPRQGFRDQLEAAQQRLALHYLYLSEKLSAAEYKALTEV